MKNKGFTREDIEALQTQWRQKNPIEAARRDAKKKAAEQKRLQDQPRAYEEDENFCLTALPRSEAAEEAYRKRINAMLEHITRKREQYVQDRNLRASELSEGIKRDFIHFVSTHYDDHNQAIAGVISALLIEGLRYPDKELNKFSFDFLESREPQNPNWTLWISLWGTEFVPLDAIRLMLKMEQSHFQAVESFREVVKIISPKIIWHLEQEYKRLKWAEQLSDPDIRSREVGRKSKRIFYFQTLLDAYGISYPLE